MNEIVSKKLKAACKEAAMSHKFSEETAERMASKLVRITEISYQVELLLVDMLKVAVQDTDEASEVNSLVFAGVGPILWKSLLYANLSMGEATSKATLERGQYSLEEAKLEAQIFASLITDIIAGSSASTFKINLEDR